MSPLGHQIFQRHPKSWLLFAAATFSCVRPDGSVSPLTPPSDLPTLAFERVELDNGLRVILHQDNRLPVVAVSVWYHVGALNERPGRTGFAHLFEHMMFQASPHVGEDAHFRLLQEAGGTDINGTTSLDRTNYYATVPANELELVLWLESDRMGFLLSSLSQKSLNNQIDVVKNERRQSVENRSYGLMDEKIMQTIYKKPHPYYGNIIGSMEDLSRATLKDVQDFFQTHYTPANATLTLAGDFDPAKAKKLIHKYFGSLRGRPRPPALEVPPPKIEGEQVIDFAEPVAQLPKLSITWMGPSAYEPDTEALDILAHVLSGTRSARLDKRMTFDDHIAQSVTAYFREMASGGMFQIDIVVRPGRTLDEALAAVDATLADLKTHPATKAERARALNALETHTITSLEALGGNGGRAERLQRYNHYLGDPGKLAWDITRYRKVSRSDIQRVLDKYLTKNRLIVRGTPKKNRMIGRRN